MDVYGFARLHVNEKGYLVTYLSTFVFCKKFILVIDNYCQFVLLEVEGLLVIFNHVLSLAHMGYTLHLWGGGDKKAEHLCVSSPNVITSRLNFTLKAVIICTRLAYVLYCFFMF